MLESRRLRHFLTTYELGSIGQAAEKLLLTQPALSKSIRQLEDDLGVRLFDRTPLGVMPTVYGNALALHAKAIEAQVRQAEAQLQSLRGVAKGVVTIGIGPSVATYMMPLATSRLQKLQPGIELSVTEGLVDDLIPALRRGEIKLAVGAWPRIADPAFSTEVLLKDEIKVWAAADHPLVGRPVELHELITYPWALPPSNQRWRQQLEEQFFERGLSPPKPAVVSNSSTFLRSLLKGGEYLSFLPRQLIGQDESLATIQVELSPFEPETSVTFKERSLNEPTVLEVIQVLRSVASEMGEAAAG
jgi:DNA-binding transcriptional LysR family regulator